MARILQNIKVINTKSSKAFWLALIIGAVAGTGINELVNWLVPDSQVKALLVKYIAFGFSPTEINLILIKFTFGLYIQFSLITVLTILLMLWILYKLL